MLFKIFLFIIWPIPFLVRWLRWLGIAQQKEYRFNRLFGYLQTAEGQHDVFKFWPQKSDFSRAGLKRPKPTLRMAVTALISILFTAGLIWFFWPKNVYIFILGMFLILIEVPDIVWISVIPTGILFRLLIIYFTWQARQKIRKHQPLIIGITGSYGKTSTKLILSHILSQKFLVFATKRSFNTPFSLARDIVRRYQNQPIMVIEFAAYKPGEIAWLTKHYPPDMALITGLTDQHLALFKTRDRIIQAKAELPTALPHSAPVFINAADQGTRLIAQQAKADNIVAYFDPGPKSNISAVSLDKLGRLEFNLEGKLIKTQLIGRQYLSACAAAVTIGRHLELSDEQIVQGLVSFKPPEYFINLKRSKLGFWVLDDGGTSNPVGFEAVIDLAKEIKTLRTTQRDKGTSGQLILITSGMIDLGKKTDAIHAKLARQAEMIFNKVCYLGKPGLAQFRQVFTSQIFTERSHIRQQLNRLDNDDMVVIEGRIPIWLRDYLKLE